MFPFIILISICFFSTKLSATPFDEVENYIRSYEKGIEDLKNSSERYAASKFKTKYDPTKYNATESLAEAEEFDFIIVGAGAAGSVLANRLSEIPEWKILVIEAGCSEDEITMIPSNVQYVLQSKYNYGYKTVPQKSWCLGSPDRKCVIESGKALGGSTVMNGMLYTRGNARDYDQWANEGNPGWNYSDVQPYFQKLEDAQLKYFDSNYHRQGGKVHIENSQHPLPLTEEILEAAKELNLQFVDYNGKDQLGIGYSQGTTKHGTRWSAAKGYLNEATERNNIMIKSESRVLKVLIDPHTKVAFGVQYLHNDKLVTAKAKKEVIISAGALHTPQLLILSGIGPKEKLQKLELDTLADLPVGQNLKDHPSYKLQLIFNITSGKRNDAREDLVEYLKNGKGPLAGLFTNLVAYIKTDEYSDKTRSDIELLFVPSEHKSKHHSDRNDNHQALSIPVVLLHPKSSGSVRISSKDPLEPPLIDLNLLSDTDDHDINTMLAGIRQAQKFLKTEPFKKLGAYLDTESSPECKEFDSDEYWKCAIRHQSRSLRHLTGTAKMGSDDGKAVVDNKLKVYKVKNLRVVDASVVPVTISGHTMAVSYLVGERGADFIKETWM